MLSIKSTNILTTCVEKITEPDYTTVLILNMEIESLRNQGRPRSDAKDASDQDLHYLSAIRKRLESTTGMNLA